MTPMLKGAALALATVLVLGAGSPARAMGTTSDTPPTKASDEDPNFAAGQHAVNDGKYADAAALMEKVVKRAPQNADAWNYLGFSERKLGKLSDALAAYEKALAINPDHRGANEYLGELYLMTGDMPKAEARLARLDKLCDGSCIEYTTLRSAIEAKKKGS